MRPSLRSSTLVYSTEGGRMCPGGCRQPPSSCCCAKVQRSAAAPGGVARVSHETRGRGGKGVTVIKGLPFDADTLSQLCKQLKAACGAGGTVKEGAIEIQGDHRDKVMAHLAQQGLPAKRSGG